ncbi:MAG: hypothetical protein K9M36_00485 [Candidatus Pacebacteria bacterium]|nr:hypothetical protein [Candidatus Paceibacterota bacterium]
MQSVQHLMYTKLAYLPVWKTKRVSRDSYRINLVLDSLQDKYVFGGVATVIIFATLFALRTGYVLRIIIRDEEAQPVAYENFLKSMNIEKPIQVEFFSTYTAESYNTALEISEKDIFVATSWWSSYLVNKVCLMENFFHIIQESEVVFYNNGDDAYWCEKVLANPRVKYIVNSRILFEYFQNSSFENIKHNSIYFEPAFTSHLYQPNKNAFLPKDTYVLLFYARPNTPRNLYYTGLKLIEEAFQKKVLEKEKWKIYFAGENIDPPHFFNGVIPHVLGKMTWEEYSDFLKKVDLGFSLLWTPHPGYMPMDIASSGGVALTNTYQKRTNAHYSKNIICGDIIRDDFVDIYFKQAVMLAQNPEGRYENYRANNMETSWEKTFEDSFLFVESILGL